MDFFLTVCCFLLLLYPYFPHHIVNSLFNLQIGWHFTKCKLSLCSIFFVCACLCVCIQLQMVWQLYKVANHKNPMQTNRNERRRHRHSWQYMKNQMNHCHNFLSASKCDGFFFLSVGWRLRRRRRGRLPSTFRINVIITTCLFYTSGDERNVHRTNTAISAGNSQSTRTGYDSP